SGFIPSSRSLSNILSRSHFLCALRSLRCLASDSLPKSFSRSCIQRNFPYSSTIRLLKYNSRARAAFTAKGISAKLGCPAFLTGFLSRRVDRKNASAYPAISLPLILARFFFALLSALALVFVLTPDDFGFGHRDNLFHRLNETFRRFLISWR